MYLHCSNSRTPLHRTLFHNPIPYFLQEEDDPTLGEEFSGNPPRQLWPVKAGSFSLSHSHKKFKLAVNIKATCKQVDVHAVCFKIRIRQLVKTRARPVPRRAAACSPNVPMQITLTSSIVSRKIVKSQVTVDVGLRSPSRPGALVKSKLRWPSLQHTLSTSLFIDIILTFSRDLFTLFKCNPITSFLDRVPWKAQ